MTDTVRRTDGGRHPAELPEEPWHGRETQAALDALSTGPDGLMQDLSGTVPLSAGQWVLATLAGAIIVPVVALEKLGRRRRSPAAPPS